MKIISLSAQNYKKLTAIEIKPDGNTVLITGRNGQGKSSVLDAIVSTLRGKKFMPEKPIQTGTDHAETKIETENYIIKRTYTEAGGGSITITNKDGMKATSPQEMLDKLVGDIAFDPMLFMNYDAKEQRKILMKLTGLDFTDIDSKIVALKSERQNIRAVKENSEHEANRITVPEQTPDEEQDLVDVSMELSNALTHNQKQNATLGDISAIEHNIDRISESIANDEDLFKKLTAQLAAVQGNIANNTKLVEKNKTQIAELRKNLAEVIDIEPIQKKMENIGAINKAVQQKKTKAELLAKVQAKTAEYSKLGAQMKSLEEEKATRLAAVKMPIEGLSVDETGVLFNGLPISQANDAKKLEIGIGIGMAVNPKLKVVLLKGNDLDNDSLRVVAEIAKEEVYQIWIQRIEADGLAHIVIEDGSVVKVNERTKDLYESVIVAPEYDASPCGVKVNDKPETETPVEAPAAEEVRQPARKKKDLF